MSVVELALRKTVDRIRNTQYENPVVTREVRTRMRGAKAHQLMLLYVFLMALCVFITYYTEWINQSQYSAQTWVNARLGHRLFNVLTWCQAILLALIAQGLTVASITIEKEQQTMEMLSLTSLSPKNIIAGKVTAPMLFILMLLACSLPIAGICLMFGSISPLEIIVTYLILIAWAFLFASAGVFFSSLSKKTSAANVATFICTGGFAWMIVGISAAAYYGGVYAGSSGNWYMIFGGMSGCTALEYSLTLAPVFGFKLPVALVGILFNVSIAVLLLTVASTRLPFHRNSKQVLIRSLLMGITLVGLFLFIGNMSITPGGFSGSSKDMIAGTLFIMLFFISPFIPIFVTGPLNKSRSVFNAIFGGRLHKKPMENHPTGGLWFITTWTIGSCCVMLLSYLLLQSHIGRSGPVPDYYAFMQASFALLAFIVAICSLGILFSTVSTTRQAAAALTVLVIVVAWIFFPIICSRYIASFNYSWANAKGFWWNIAYLWPGLPFEYLSNDLAPGSTGPILAIKDTDWTCTGCAVAWSLVAILALWAANRKNERGGGVPDE